MKNLKNVLLCLSMMAALLFAGCGNTTSPVSETEAQKTEETAEETAEETTVKKIGVTVYNTADPEVQAFRNYLENYIGDCFEVDFVYSSGITTIEEELEYIANAKENDIAGIISFTSQDLAACVEACAEQEIYYMRGSGSVSEEDFDKVKDNPYFLGAVGPGKAIEKEAGKNMAAYFAEELKDQESVRYMLLTGGAASGNAMHKYRAQAILEELGADPALADSKEMTCVEAGKNTICIVPGLLRFEEVSEAVKAELDANEYDVLLSTLTVNSIESVIKDKKDSLMTGSVDCFDEENMNLFLDGAIDYVTGKYPSLVGPSFALMYNAMTGHADDFRNEDGSAVQIAQGFWTAAGKDAYEALYQLTAGVYVNAYSNVDLAAVISEYSEDASLEALISLAESCSEDDVRARCEAR